jgi:hypothetical protein
MGTSGGVTAIAVDETRAEGYYRGAGFDTLLVRGRPRFRPRPNLVQIQTTNLAVGQVVELIVYPELILRSKPWRLWGRVTEILDHIVIVEQLSGEQIGTTVKIPSRYFHDGRVFRWEGFDEN